MRKYLTLIFVLALILFAGCRTYQPPERAVAYMFPSLIPGGSLNMLHPQEVSADELTLFLKHNALLELLEDAAFPPDEMQIVCRGLKRRGYAEIDARRSERKLQWMAFLGSAENEITVCVAVSGQATGKIVWQRQASPQ